MHVHTPTPEQYDIAAGYYDGSTSTLYAIASTGALTTGTRRPTTSDTLSPATPVWRPMTDAEWRHDLAWRLLLEVRALEPIARDEDLDTIAEWLETLEALTADLAQAVDADEEPTPGPIHTDHICTDCLEFAYNGGPEEPPDHWTPPPNMVGFAAEYDEHGEMVHGFHNASPCHACGSWLGGDRYHGTILRSE